MYEIIKKRSEWKLIFLFTAPVFFWGRLLSGISTQRRQNMEEPIIIQIRQLSRLYRQSQRNPPLPARKLNVVLIQDPKAVGILGFPGFLFAAKMQDGRVFHYPPQVIGTAAA